MSLFLTISDNDPIYIYCEQCILKYSQTLDESYLYDILTEDIHDTDDIESTYELIRDDIRKRFKGRPVDAYNFALNNDFIENGASRQRYAAQFYDMAKDDEDSTYVINDIDPGLIYDLHTDKKYRIKGNKLQRSYIDDFKFGGPARDITTKGAALGLGAGIAYGLLKNRPEGKELLKKTSGKLDELVIKYKNAPKSVIGKKIRSLRKLYFRYMMEARKFPDQSSFLKRIAGKILSVIDMLLEYIERKVG